MGSLTLVSFRSTPSEFIPQVVQQLTRFYIDSRPEKSYLHLDKDVYSAGETIWYKAYTVDGQAHQPDSLSQTLYVDLLAPNQQLVQQQVLQLRRGTAPGDFALPDTLRQGTYTMRAYTSWMRNAGAAYFFSREVTILSGSTADNASARRIAPAPTTKPLDLQFFPEGGQLVAGLSSIVGFKATNAYGRGVEATGTIQDEQGTTVASFSTQHLGMGRLQLTPEAGHRYVAQLQLPNGQQLAYKLPEVQASGFTLRIVPLGNAYRVLVQRRATAANAPTERITLVAQVRGQVAYTAQGMANDMEFFSALIPKDRFVGGVAHFTLFDGNLAPRCERLVFVDAAPNLRVQLQPDKATYAPHEKVTVHLRVTDADGHPATGQFSLAVNGTSQLPIDSTVADIRTHLLLTSDLHGQVEQPRYYFQGPPSADREQALDNLLLTQGWRRFTWQQVLTDQNPSVQYPLERGSSVNGQVLGHNKQPAEGIPVTMFRFGRQPQVQITTTDANGRFGFGGFSGQDTARVLVQVKPTKNIRNPVIIPDQHLPEFKLAALYPAPVLTPAPVITAYLASSQRTQTMERQFRPDAKTIVLGKVTVKGKRIVPSDPRRALYTQADKVIKPADIGAASTYSDVLQLLSGRVPGITVTPGLMGQDSKVSIRGSDVSRAGEEVLKGQISPDTGVLFLLDGIPVNSSTALSVPMMDIESVEVLKGASAALLGSRGINGVIAILTKRGGSTYNQRTATPAPGLLSYMLPKYYQAREFYVPAYGSGQHVPPVDFRGATLYWNPTITTDMQGQASVSFYASDEVGPFRLALQGLSDAGVAATATARLRVVSRTQ